VIVWAQFKIVREPRWLLTGSCVGDNAKLSRNEKLEHFLNINRWLLLNKQSKIKVYLDCRHVPLDCLYNYDNYSCTNLEKNGTSNINYDLI